MASITRNKGNGRYKVMLTKEELRTMTIALALLDIPTMEDEMREQNLTDTDVSYEHLKMFDIFTKATKMYPKSEVKEELDETV